MFLTHETVNHSQGEYARGDVHTNTTSALSTALDLRTLPNELLPCQEAFRAGFQMFEFGIGEDRVIGDGNEE